MEWLFFIWLHPSQRAHHVESMSIRRGYYGDTSKNKFRRISTSFPRTFSIWFRWSKNPRCFTYFYQCNFDGRNMHVVFTFFDVILMGKDLTSLLVSCKLIKTFEKVIPVLVTLNSWFLQDCSLQIFQVNLAGVTQFHWNLSLTISTTAKRTVAS